MSLLDIVNEFFGGGSDSPDIPGFGLIGSALNGGGSTGPMDIRPPGFDQGSGGTGGESPMMQEMLKYMHDAIPRPEDDFRKKIGNMIYGFGEGVGKANPSTGWLGQIGGGVSGAAEGYKNSDDDVKAQRAKGAATLFDKLLNQGKVESAQAVADERLRQGDDRLRQGDDRIKLAEALGYGRLGQGDRRLDQGDTRNDQGQQRIDDLQRYRDTKREDDISKLDDKQRLDWEQFYETQRKNGNNQDMAWRNYQRNLAKDKETQAYHEETIQTRQDGQRMANEIKRRIGSKADPMKLWLDANKMVENRRAHDFKNLDPQWDKEEWDRRMRKFEEFQTGVFNVIPNPQVNQEGGTTQPAPPPGQPAPSVQARPRVAAGMVDRAKAIAGAKAAKAAGVPDAEILKRLKILNVDPKEAGF